MDRPRGRTVTVEAVVWRRSDFRESSRLVTLITREQGRIVALAKGAHRKDSAFLGRLDLLNQVRARIGRRDDVMPLLHRVELRHEPRALRAPDRFLAASYLIALTDPAWVERRTDPPLYDLLIGGLTLLELCPGHGLANVVIGLELRLLQHLGGLPALDRCSVCDRPATGTRLHTGREAGGLTCPTHTGRGAFAVPEPTRAWLASLCATAGSSWPEHPPAPRLGTAAGLLAPWLDAALERLPRLRGPCLTALAARAGAPGDRAVQ